jgi:hypothetical protein
MSEFEVFRITPEVGNLCYEYAESTRIEGRWPSERHFTNSVPLYVGRLIKVKTGGYGDHGWRRDYFEDNKGVEHVVNYSYGGTTCFRAVPCVEEVKNAESLATLVHTGKTNRSIAHSINNFLTNKQNPYLDNGIFYKKDNGKGQKSRRKRVKKSRRRKSRGQKY